MSERDQVVRFTENYVDDETRISYYRGDEVKVSEGEYARAFQLGAIEHLGAAAEYEGQVAEPQEGVAMPPQPKAEEAQEG